MAVGPEKIFDLNQLAEVLQLNHPENKIIFAHGVFDLLHRGHVTLLAEAKKLGGILVVGVENDDNVKILKGTDRPIHSEEARLFVLSHLEPIDYLFLIPHYENIEAINAFYTNIYRKLRANILATCLEAGRYGVLKQAHANEVGIQFVDIKTRYDRSTSTVINLLRKLT